MLFHEVLCTTNKQKEKKTLSELLPRITMFIDYKMIHTILTKEVQFSSLFFQSTRKGMANYGLHHIPS